MVERLGADSYLYVDLDGGGTLTVRAAGDSTYRAGDAVRIGMPAGEVHLFDGAGRALPRVEQAERSPPLALPERR